MSQEHGTAGCPAAEARWPSTPHHTGVVRLFASIDIPRWIAEPLEERLPPLPDGVRGIPRQRWHLTLAFYGEVDAEGADCIRRRLGERLAHWPGPALRLRIVGGGAFSGGASYLAVSGETQAHQEALLELARLCQRVGLRCHAPGTSPRERFRAHVTVSRLRRGAGLPPDYLQALQQIGSPEWEPRSIDLVESMLHNGPQYVVRDRFPLPAPRVGDAGG